MPSTDSPAVLVARFLKANNYTQTLEAFVQEAGLAEASIGSGDSSDNDGYWTIERILDEKLRLEASQAYEKVNEDGGEAEAGWTTPAPTVPHRPSTAAAAAAGSNVLCVRGSPSAGQILVSTADRRVSVLAAAAPYAPVWTTAATADDSPVLSLSLVERAGRRYCLTTSMSGELTARRWHGDGTYDIVDRVRDHTKYAVAAAILTDGGDDDDDSLVIATAGWDKRVLIYQATTASSSASSASDADTALRFGRPIHSISLATVPEALVFARNPASGQAYLVLARRDSTLLYYYAVGRQPDGKGYTVSEARPHQNLAPHSPGTGAFTPACLALSSPESGGGLLAAATSHLPHMHLIIARLLFPDQARPHAPSPTAARQAGAEREKEEEAAILVHANTMAPQTAYSTPAVVWRPDASGVWVNGDDGAVRGFEASTGRPTVTLPNERAAATTTTGGGGHEAGAKVRTLWSGRLGGREVLLSGGFDKRLVVWECEGHP